MKKSHLLLIIIVIIGVIAFVLPALPGSTLGNSINWGIITTALVILCIVAFLFEFEGTVHNSKEIALISMMATLSAALRIPLAAIPGVQPCTFLIICTGYVFGPIAGFMVGAMTALISNFFLGQGPWTPYQMLAWGLIGIIAAYFRRFHPRRKALAFFGLLCGYIYGAIINIWFWSSFIYPLTITTFTASMLNSIWFDTLHAVANVTFLAIFGMRTITILERFKKRFSIEFIRRKTTV